LHSIHPSYFLRQRVRLILNEASSVHSIVNYICKLSDVSHRTTYILYTLNELYLHE